MVVVRMQYVCKQIWKSICFCSLVPLRLRAKHTADSFTIFQQPSVLICKIHGQ